MLIRVSGVFKVTDHLPSISLTHSLTAGVCANSCLGCVNVCFLLVFLIFVETGSTMEDKEYVEVSVNIAEKELPDLKKFVEERCGEIKVMENAVNGTQCCLFISLMNVMCFERFLSLLHCSLNCKNLDLDLVELTLNFSSDLRQEWS